MSATAVHAPAKRASHEAGPEPAEVLHKSAKATDPTRVPLWVQRSAAPAGFLQRSCCDGSMGDAQCEACAAEEEEPGTGQVQRRAPTSDGPRLNAAGVSDVLSSPGQPLERDTRQFMESRFGRDFGPVRVHTDAAAAATARAVHAVAYTVGSHVVFGNGHYRPASHEGRHLIAHELTHVLQQQPLTPAAMRPGADRGSADVALPSLRAMVLTTPRLHRQTPPYPGVIGHCRSIGVPCPAPHFHHGTVCRLVHCVRAATANLPFAISPGICIYQCLDGRICTCVLLGSSTSAVCVITLCDSPGQASAEPDYDALADRALAMAEEQFGSGQKDGEAPEAQAKLEISQPGDAYEQEAEATAGFIMRMADPALEAWPLSFQHSPADLVQRATDIFPFPRGRDGVTEDLFGPSGGNAAPGESSPPRYRGSTLPRREALELLECVRIMGEENSAYCRQQVLGEPVPVPPPAVCVPSRTLTWADFRGGLPPAGREAFTNFHFDLVTGSGGSVVQAVFDGARSRVRPRFSDPTNRAATGCAAVVQGCNQAFSNPNAVGPLPLTTPGLCAASPTPNPSAVAMSGADCDTVLGTECDRIRTVDSARLLRHEQLHFDIACVLARKGTAALAAAPTRGTAILAAVRAKATQLSSDTGQYDTQTSHGCNPTAQATWEADVAAGLPAHTIP